MTTNPNEHRTLSGLPIDPLYSPERLADAGFDPAADLGNPGAFPFTRGAYPTMYRGRSVDPPPDRRLWHRPGHQRALPLPPGSRADRSQHRLRPPDAHRLRLRPRASRGRGGPLGRRHRHRRRHGRAFRRHPPGTGQRLPHHQPPGHRAAGNVPPQRGASGNPVVSPARHRPERLPQGVPRPEDLRPSAGPGPASHHRRRRVLHPARAQLVHHLHQRLPHPRGRLRRRAGTGVHRRPGHGLRGVRPMRRGLGRGRVRAQPVPLLRRAQRLLRGDRQVPRRSPPVGAPDARPLRRHPARSPCGCASTPKPWAPRWCARTR